MQFKFRNWVKRGFHQSLKQPRKYGLKQNINESQILCKTICEAQYNSQNRAQNLPKSDLLGSRTGLQLTQGWVPRACPKRASTRHDSQNKDLGDEGFSRIQIPTSRPGGEFNKSQSRMQSPTLNRIFIPKKAQIQGRRMK